MKKFAIFIFTILLLCIETFGQTQIKYDEHKSDLPEWVKLMYKENPDVGEVVKAYKKYYESKVFEKNTYTQFYKHWLIDHTRSSKSKSKFTTKKYKDNLESYIYKSLSKKSAQSEWECIGPFDFDKDAADRSYAPGAAHCYTVEQSASNPNVLYAGTATAGLWKTIDKGQNWTLLTRDFILNTIFALEIDFLNEDIIYFGGAGKVYKSTDGGQNWIVTGDQSFQNDYHTVKDILMHPTNSSILFLASDLGFYRTIDAGANWDEILLGTFQEIEFHTSNPDIIYTIKQTGNKTEFYKSIDNGLSFSLQTNGWPMPISPDEQKRTEISVSAAAPENIWALATGAVNGGSGLYGLYSSQDAGANWSFICCGPQPGGPPSLTNPNLMGWSDEGTDDGGQYYFDLALEVSPVNSNKIHIAGVNHWVSNDGGNSFTCPSKWSHPEKVEYVHADIHDVGYFGNDLWMACDGGIFYSSTGGDTINRMMYGISGTDFWGFGAGFWDGEVMLGGTYHNGTLLKDNDVYLNGWICTQGGDNFRGFVNYGNGRQVYHDGGGKLLSGDRNVYITPFPFSMMSNASYFVGESSNLEFDPCCYNIIYTGINSLLMKSENNGSSFHMIHDFNEDVTSVKVAWTNPDYIYVATYSDWWGTKKLWKSTDGGANWTEITPTSSEINGYAWVPYDIAVSSEDENIIWIARTSQYSDYPNIAGYQAFKSEDGGNSWINISTNTLDGEYPTNIVHQRGTNGGVYIGTRRAVYYRNNGMIDWELFNNNLPLSTSSIKLVPHYRKSKIRNATNRSVYECDFIENSIPIAQISADRLQSFCTRDTIYYVDHSCISEVDASWSWEFPGGSPSTSAIRNPKVVYSVPGTYSVSLTVTDTFGTDNQTISDFITISSECQADTIPGMALNLSNSGDYASIPSLNINTNSISMSAWIKPNIILPEYTGFIMHHDVGAGINIRQNMELGYHWPGGNWGWNSGLFIQVDKWSHVALVVCPDSITVYLNGIYSSHVVAPDSVNFNSSTDIGSYHGWASRNFSGEIDEVCIWNKAISQNEIREQMHLTKIPSSDLDLIAYYQFNRNEGMITDRANIFHAEMNGAASRIESNAPVGGGTSYRLDVYGGMLADFTGTGIVLDFQNSGTFPNGELVASRINLLPDHSPNVYPLSESYWIINNYGENDNFTSLTGISFYDAGNISTQNSANPSKIKLYKRNSNEYGDTWGNIIDSADIAINGENGDVFFNNMSPINNFGQLVISFEGDSVSTIVDDNCLHQTQDFIHVYPNPISRKNYINIVTNIENECKFVLYNSNATIVMSENFSKQAAIKINNLKKGTYFYQVRSSRFIKNGKLVILK
jgi:PKD repeat protein/photosystem II stability/assembly factor-like uncharacterized protein